MKTKYIDMTQDMNVFYKPDGQSETCFSFGMARKCRMKSNVNGKFTDIYSYIKKILFLTVLLTVGATSTWAQTDYSGTYLIKSVSANKLTPGDYYICPTEGWIYYTGTNSFTEEDNGQPFLTTYQCKTGGYDVRKAVWKIEKSGDYYTIKHVIDGKYMVYNGKISNANAGRIRIHLADVATPGDNEKFVIGTNKNGKIVISPMNESTTNFFNPCQGNINSLAGSTEYNGTKPKNDGPTTPFNHQNDIHGTIGLYKDKDDVNAPFELETAVVCETPTITYNESTHEVSISTITDGATIYYTTDGTEPTTSSSSYTVPFTVSNTTHIKAIAVKAGNINSLTASKHVVKYTYIIVNSSGNIAIQYTTPYPVAAGTPLSGYSSIPDDIKSPFISDESITYKSFDGPFSAAALEAADELTETPTTSNIYITYTTTHLSNKFLHLQGVRTFNIKNSSSQFVYDDGTDTSLDFDSSVDPTIADKRYVWYFTSQEAPDPYAVTVRNVGSKNYLTYTSSTLGLANLPQTYIIKNSVPLNTDPEDEDATGTLTLQSTDGSIVFSVTPVKLPLSYTLIDKAGKVIESNITYTGIWGLPAEWQSPIATYKYYKAATIVGDTYSFSEEDRINGIDEAEDNVVYVTYDVSSAIDIQGSKTYLLKFSDGATDFHPENGNNGVSGTAIKATYPYNNGDFNLYIYGATEWTNQLSNGASTRTRWLWYLISNHNGTDLTGDAIDPYHVIIKSRQNQVYKVGSNSYDGNSYLYTYKPTDAVGVVTGVITQHDVVKTLDPTLKPTEYMLLGTDVNHMVLKTVNEIDGSRQTVNKFEQYWKNYPTVQTVAGVANPAADNTTLAEKGWHRYQDWAYAEPWGGGTKTLEKGDHWFQTVSMGSGEFSVEEVALEPEVILLDQHGWEIARVPVSQTAKLKKYDSPMVEEYQWYPKANKVSGYHKYTIPAEEAKRKIDVYENSANPENENKVEWHVVRSVSYTSSSLSETPEGNVEGYAAQDKKYKTDFYVTYTVKSDYADTYVGAATEGSVKASSFFVKQGGKYAQNNSNIFALVDKPSLTGEIPTNVQWKVKPNFNIDHEMGYKYLGETGAQPDAESKDDTEAAYNAAGKNGFDPYNVQIQSVSNTARYFSANTGSTTLDHGIWTGTGSSTVSLREMSVGHISAEGPDHTTLDITNATFIVVDDGNGNMRLMPRFDNTKVMTSVSGLSTQLAAAPVGDDGAGTQSLYLELVPTIITSTDEILSMKGYYILAEGFTQTKSLGTKVAPFEGTIDGQLNHFSFSDPLVLYAKDATIRNVILEGVTISSGSTDGNVGAICCEATGDTRIYNCGINHSTTVNSSVSGSNYVGGIVGLLAGSSRVINCYSYANITSGTDVGGIVGHNDYASKANDIRTMVMNCAFYGDITGGGTKSPVYGGYNIANTSNGLNNYNYYAYAQLPSSHLTDNKYNTALAVADEDFQRFEFYRLLLNSNRRLAGYYITGRATDADLMAKWVLETADRDQENTPNPKPYPVLKIQGYYPSIINYDVENAPDSISVGRNKGGKLGKTLTVHLSGTGITTSSLTIQRTDKDFDRYNFNYDKIQLPYFNDVGTGNYTNNQVVTGWEITSMTGGTAGTYTAGDSFGGYNFADRKCTNKDLIGTSGRIFSQGAYFDVPYGVTDIYIQPHWATAAYVADEYLDVVYTSAYDIQSVSAPGNSFKQFPTGKITINGSEQVVHKTIASAIATFSKGSVYDYAVVLVGNLHQNNVPLNDDSKRFTMMSADLDNDHEPDYSMIYHHNGRLRVCPIRFDFLNVIGTAYAQKPNGASLLRNTTIFKTSGWFEVTNTALMYSNQMEYENTEKNVKEDAPLILLGGKFDQFVSTQSSAVNGKTIYIHVGGNVWIDQFGLGTHSDGSKSTPHVPVSVTGGEYKGFYLTGTYNQDAEVRTDNAECYISGGHFVEAAGACQEAINGDVHWQIYNADIDAFYGGGINAARPIKGHVTTEITNSYVTTFCGGPKFGDMQTGKDVRTTATGCVFERYYGAGFGGTSYSRKKYHDAVSYNFTNLAKHYSPNDRGKYFDGATTNSKNGGGTDAQYGKKGIGVATDFDYEFFVWSSGQTGARFFVKFASFSLANCIDVYSTLNNCTINQNFYGGGSFGSVSGTANSVLNGCTVHGNVFGGGYSATREKVPVRNSGFTTIPKYNDQSGMFEPGVFSGTTEYEWKHVAEMPANGTTAIEDDGDNHYLYTDVDLDALGKVGNTVLTIQGATVVEGKIFQYDSNGKVVKDGAGNNVVLETTGGVFGGGDMSAVNHSTQVTVKATGTNGVLNVFGGGNTADVIENTAVTITGGTIGGSAAASDTNGNVYGGGKGSTTVVGGNVTVNLGTKTGEAPSFTYKGDGLVKHNVYGGSAFGSVNTTPNASSEYNKTTTVNIYKGTVNGSVFGGGLGQLAVVEPATPEIVAKNYGATTVNMEGGLVKTAVYGGANVNGVLKNKVYVNMLGGTVNAVPDPASNIKNVVFGGGYGEPTIVEGDIAVTIGTQAATPDNSKPTVYGNVYGGSALGKVQVSEDTGNDLLDNKIDIHLYGGTIYGNVFGGGLGQKNGVNGATSDIAARVGGNVNVLLDGSKLDIVKNLESTPLTGQIFGANNLNGTPKGHVKVHVKRTVDSDKSSEEALAKTRDERTTYDVAAVYGGGNQADYIPTNALLTTNPADPSYDAGNPAKVEAATAEVIIEGCDLTSIEYVYGGGNAAAVPATDVTIIGSHIIDYVFGGGNGKSTASFVNPGANVGSYNGATNYGSGKAVTKLVGCHAHYVFGGSNTKGNVREGTSILMPDTTAYKAQGYDFCSVRDVREIYGAGNEAEQDGNVTLILGCVHNMKNVYGGARNANVKGGIDLVVTSGSFEGVFGGNDMSGTIQGPITVTIEETGCDPLEIDNLYLGGNHAAYSIYGYKSDGTARTKVEYDALTDEQKTAEHLPYSDPVLNVVSCTRIGKTSGEDLGGAFGGGLGNGAVMYGSPTVNINMIPGKYGVDSNGDDEPDVLGTITNVYGGGKLANVVGNTAVNIGTVEKIAHRTSMGSEIPVGERIQKDVQSAIITGNVFGAGKGRASAATDVDSAFVSGNTTILIEKATIAKSVYGGGELSQVGGNTNITVRGGAIGDHTGANAGETYGNVYGGGMGNTTNVRSGLVKGNTNITIQNTVADEDYHTAHPETAVGTVLSSPSIYHNIYGGGAHGSVGTYSYASEAVDAAISGYTSGGVATITITGGTIGVNGKDNGMVCGASRGDVGAPESINDNVAWVYSTNVVIGTEGQGSNHTSPHVKGSVYGGGENGHVYQNASLTIHSGMVGIAEGSPITDNNGTPEDPSDDITYTGANYPYRGNVYGAGCGTDKYDNNTKYNPKSGIVNGNATVIIDGGHVVRDVYGAGSMGSVNDSTKVTIAGNAVIGADGSGGGYVFAAARGDAAAPTMATVGSSNLNISGGTIWMDAYGGGQNGAVKGAVAVSMTGGTVKHDVYGGGALAQTNTDYNAGSEPANTYTTTVTLNGTTINGNLYGGGLGQLAEAGPPAVAAVAANVNGPVTVTVSNGKATNVFGCNNLYGAPQRTVAVNVTGTASVESGSAISNVYGGGNLAAYTGNPTVTVSGGTVNNVYGGGYGATAIVTGNTAVTISGGTIGNDVYGGGSEADVTGNVDVTISGTGTVKHDVYGGGALANTNTGNWNSSTGTWLDTNTGTYYAEVKHVKKDVTDVSTYYTRSDGEPPYTYTPAAGLAAENTTYYKKLDGFLNVAANGTQYKTTLSLTGGTVGNAYGGGLGKFTATGESTGEGAVAAMVYGDVSVTVNGTKFTQETARVDGKAIPLTGRVFGGNNKNGTPKGSITVLVQQTKRLDGTPGHVKNQFEIQGVYGGGNMSHYVPVTYDIATEFGQKTKVIIEGCNQTSIERVYGGGNASDVPFSDVLIEGTFQIGYVFGGGNGGDKINKIGSWIPNPGANVTNYTNVVLHGGTIGDAFGGSDSQGDVGGTNLVQAASGECELVINNIYGASKEADSNGDVTLDLSGCGRGEVDKVFGGSYNANVRGNVTINITSGIYTSVYGGNDRKGSVGGNITINVEEIDQCNPIIIQNLFGGGSQADYPGPNAKKYIGVVPIPEGVNPTNTPASYESFTSGTLTLNIKAATRIDRVYGGCDNAKATGNTFVNINMVKGSLAGNGFTLPASYTGDPIPNIHENVIDDAIGTIGFVYGGGNQGDVDGNTTVNIGTLKDVAFEKTPNHLVANGSSKYDVLGAHIFGDVFGGGNEGEVTGNTTVNIGTADYSETANFEGIFIDKNASGKGGSVYGGGSAADVLGNTNVTMEGGYVFDGVYGGGLKGSVGTAADGEGNVVYHTGTEAHAGTCIGKIVNYKEGTGKCTVVVNGGQVGPAETAMTNGGMKNTGHLLGIDGPVDVGFVFGAGRGEETPHEQDVDTDFRTYVKETDVTIGGDAFIMASVYGGGENGRVRGNTHVKIQGDCQIGCGEGKVTDGKPVRYTAEQWTGENKSDFTECASWDYGKIYPGETEKKYLPYDPLASDTDPDARKEGSDGRTYYGSVFGGGSGYFPHEKADGTHDWLRSAGQVEGSTKIEITGGHILTCVYGGNETTDVLGDSCVVIMTGGTLGVPRTDEAIKARPVTCYLFGAGKGDQRTRFNTWTNVQNTRVFVGGTARIFGSVFGGGEDGHILKNSKVQIFNGTIGTGGTSYLDGNVFGGGRGFSGVALTAGSMGGNAEVTIAGGWMKGSVYGGGRLASVGIGFTSPEDINYGQLKDDKDGNTYGHVTINISGGEIGNRTTETGAGHPVSGNVFGGSMGRITLLDGETRIPLWPKQAVTKLSNVTISGGTIWNSVYGGSEIGIVRNRATVNVSGGTIHGNVFGGGYGSDEQDKTTIAAGGYDDLHYTFTPMIWTGCVSGDTEVNISGGKVEKNVYGGGNYASVGLMNFNSNEEGTVYNYITKHDTENGFGLSWPYEFQYIQAAPKDNAPGGKAIGGKTTVNITGGIIGTLDGESIVVSGTGNVYGASKGMVSLKKEDNTTPITDVNEQRYAEAFCANVRETEVTIGDGGTPNIYGAVYGGGQDGHVMENAAVTVAGGTIGLSVYGGGQGESTFLGKLRDQSSGAWKAETEAVHSITAGKVYGNTSVSMTGGLVVGHVYGGGNLASVGKGNYAGGADDYYPAGYGEKLTGNLWDNVSDNSKAFLNSGNVTVSITGGKVGTLNGTSGSVYGTTDTTPTGMVFGGSRGRAAEDIMLDPRHEYAPDFYLGYVNNTTVTIGNTSGGAPEIFSQVFGGGRDGHVRNSTHVIVNDGTIGQTYDETTGVAGSTADYQRYHRGNVYGSGSGLGQWTTGKHGMSSGSVTNKTTVDINGGTIYNNVYGGGALSSVGPPRLNLEKDYAAATISQCVVNINGGTIGQTTPYETHKYGGCVYGASRGADFAAGESEENFATVLWTKVNINGGSIAGNVYGGAKGGLVWKDTEVHLKGGTIAHNAYGGGQGTSTIAANIGGNTTVKLNEGKGASDSGCVVEKVFGCNDLNGTPKGHVLVHVYATQHKGTNKIVPAGGKYTKFNKLSEYTISNYEAATNAADLGSLAAAAGLTTDQINVYKSAIAGASGADAQKAAIDDYIEGIATKKYDVLAVYGGGDLAPYVPNDPTPGTPLNDTEEYAEVIIEGCDLTSIKQVYGGGNAASVPATKLTINSAYEIHESFGGGNGKDNYELDTKWYENPGANIGYSATYHHNTSSGGSRVSPYAAVQNNGSDGYADATTKEARIANYSYGTGQARIEVYGGRIHRSYGGSNERGNIRYEASSAYEESGSCEMRIDETYGGGKNAETDADVRTDMECVDYTDELYGGSTNGDVNSNIVLNITNGTFGKVFGGNKVHGRIFGSITVNVKETGCKPIIIDKLYIGGDQAHYSIYGYSGAGNATARTKKEYEELTPAQQAAVTVQKDPRLNIISATRINNVYGGGYAARVVGNPHINVNMEEGTLAAKFMKNHADYLTTDQTDTRITGTVKWRCRQGAEVEFEDHTIGHDGILPIGTIGNIYGGGDQALVDGSTTIEIGTGKHHNEEGVEEVLDPARSAAYITGRVYGGGNLGDVSGNATIEMGNGYVADRIYGGGKEGHVGTISTRNAADKPTAFAENTGKTTVTISGGHVGPFEYSHLTGDEARAKVTIIPMTMPQDFGYVFGGGRGELVNPATDPDIHNKTYVNETEVIIKNTYEEAFEGDSLAHIVRSPLIAGGVYGGSENGRVLHNTHVNIWGGQIGIGKDLTTAYAESAFIDPTTTTVTDENKLAECAAWPYGIDTNSDEKKDTWLPYDEHAGDASYPASTYGNASTTGSDGHTFYGNVFGGGSGYFAYAKGDGTYEWLPSAGLVEGDTYVNISGGHILTNVYGGNDLTNVTGTAHVTMTGGTLGVPRTLAQIAAHPVTCYLFGGGKGDQRVHFNMSTNVGHAVVNVSGGIIYGSVFGGGEDGHVLGNVTMNIGTAAVGTEGQEGYVAAAGPTIGTWGTSYVEGNVFGGGRGFAGDALTAGVVCGNVNMNIKGGTMLGSIYGGGRLGSIGTHLEPSNHANYGKLIPDNRDEDYETGADYVHSGSTHGYVTINISGGTIGNNNEYIIPQAGNIPDGLDADPKNWETADNWTAWKTHNNVPNTDYVYDKDLGFVRLTHTKGGNVFAGAMGRMYALDGTTPLTRWYDLGMVKSTRLTITGGTIKSNVYGGGELGWTAGKHKHSNTALTATDSLSTEILIRGGTIGTEVKEAGDVTRYTFGSVYGGGYGNATEKLTDETNPKFIAGRVVGATSVKMEDGQVKGSIFGGGEVANVGLGFYSYKSDITGGTKGGFTKDDSGIAKTGEAITAADIAKVSTYVDVSGGTVGIAPITISENLKRHFGGATMGNVYGGGSGNRTIVRCGLVLGNSNVSISQAEGKTTRIYHNVYGGGSFGSVGDYEYESQIDLDTGTEKVYGVQAMHTAGTGEATVSITGGTIGSNGHENGMVFGSSRGDITNPHSRDNYMAWVNNATVTIGTEDDGANYATPTVKGSVYGSGENGHTFGNTVVTVNSGTVGVPSAPVVVPDPSAPDDPEKATTYYGANYSFRGNVYGGGCGTDTYEEDGEVKYNPEAGIVRGNTTVNINGGLIAHSVYGAGSMGSVGTITNLSRHADETNSFALSWPYEFTFAENTGKATVNINGGHIGVQLTDGNIEIKGDGDVYGSARGEAGDRYAMARLALVKETEVNVNYPSTADMADVTDLSTPCVTGSVHGSGENGYVYGDTKVTMNEGLIGHSLYGAGKGKGTYTKTLRKLDDSGDYSAEIYSLIAGKVMGNTYVTMNGGIVGRNVYGGGNMASVGKGSYTGGADDYSTTGYGENITGNLWDGGNENSLAFLNSGKTTVNVISGTVGYIDKSNPGNSMKNQLPYGNVIGGSAGEAAPNIDKDPRYEYSPAFFSGYVNETDVTIGGYRCKTAYTDGSSKDHAVGEVITEAKYKESFTGDAAKWEIVGPTILASVYGGGQDGHVRRDTKVTVLDGEIGLPYNSTNQGILGNLRLGDGSFNPQWLHRGNVYGGGSGITEYKYDYNGDGDYDDANETGYSSSSGSVTRFTEVNVLGGIVHRDVYGGGSLGSVGAPKIDPESADPYKKDLNNAATLGKQSQCTVNIRGQIGTDVSSRSKYGGDVFGACRGNVSLDANQFGTAIWTRVNILDGATIHGNVFGGGDAGMVKKDTKVVVGDR